MTPRIARRVLLASVVAVIALAIVYTALHTDKGESFWADQFLNGLTLGSLYALIALGYTMVYGVLRMINFAHGEIFMVGSFAGWITLNEVFGGNDMATALIAPAIVVAMLVAALASSTAIVVIERIAYRPLRHSPRLTPLISAIGVSIFLQNLFLRLRSGQTDIYPRIFPQGPGESIDIGVTDLAYVQIFLIGSSVMLMLVLYFFIQRTRIGTSIRAVAEDRDVAALMGINGDRVILLTFVIGAALAGVAGVMYGLWLLTIKGTMGFLPGIKAFTAAVLGGIGNIPGAMLGGLLIGLSETIGREWLNELFGLGLGNQWKDVVAFFVLVGVLLLRPTGILGEVVGKRA